VVDDQSGAARETFAGRSPSRTLNSAFPTQVTADLVCDLLAQAFGVSVAEHGELARESRHRRTHQG
jgi:hypothetical protein